MYLYGCSTWFGVGDKGLKNSVEYIQQKLIQRQNMLEEQQIDIINAVKKREVYNPKMKYLHSVLASCNVIANKADQIIKNGGEPLFITGDHSAAIGSVSASSNNFDDLGLIWIDAHPDINTDKTTVTGNIHGMPVAALLGLGEKSLTKVLNNQDKLRPKNIIMLGLRDIDPPEKIILEKLNIKYYTYYFMKKRGILRCLEDIKKILCSKFVHVSIDIDSMDPQIIPGVSTPVKEGFGIAEMNSIISFIRKEFNTIAWDIAEYNHVHDINDITVDYIISMIELISKPEYSVSLLKVT